MVLGKNGYNYTIEFKNTDQVIDLKSNSNVMEDVEVLKHLNDNMYYVLSQKNDKNLKELLMAEFNLQANQVIVVVPRGVMGLGGFM